MTPEEFSRLSYIVAGVVFVVAMAVRWRMMHRPRRLRLERLWIVPTLYTLFAVGLFWEWPPRGIEWLWSAGALALGGAIGWWRGGAMRIAVDPLTHDLNQRQSPLALLIIAGLIAVRFGLRSELGMDDPSHFSHGLLDAFAAFAVGLLSFQRLEMFLRARRLLVAARAERDARGTGRADALG